MGQQQGVAEQQDQSDPERAQALAFRIGQKIEAERNGGDEGQGEIVGVVEDACAAHALNVHELPGFGVGRLVRYRSAVDEFFLFLGVHFRDFFRGRRRRSRRRKTGVVAQDGDESERTAKQAEPEEELAQPGRRCHQAEEQQEIDEHLEKLHALLVGLLAVAVGEVRQEHRGQQSQYTAGDRRHAGTAGEKLVQNYRERDAAATQGDDVAIQLELAQLRHQLAGPDEQHRVGQDKEEKTHGLVVVSDEW